MGDLVMSYGQPKHCARLIMKEQAVQAVQALARLIDNKSLWDVLAKDEPAL